ncbi:hypothetical protein [Candidatus Rickettsia kedanie]|uniref:Uncharacterized protein n=1 Tax=Candidatus Rickettsia kedanie TaxID=3115352 RepID=A0ABP9TT05_9RICK
MQGNVGNETLGTKANTLAVINVSGNVGVVGTNAKLGTNGLDVRNTAVLNIAASGVFVDASLTSARIGELNIGDANAGPAVYALDAINADFDLDAPGVAFKNDSSILKLMTTSADVNTPSTIYLTGNIEPLTAHTVIVELNAQNAGVTLIIDGDKNKGMNPDTRSLGTVDYPLKQITFLGDGDIGITAFAMDTINISIPVLGIETVNTNVFFAPPTGTGGPTQFSTTIVKGSMDFQNVTGTAIFKTANNTVLSITGNITSTSCQPKVL